MVKHPGVDFEIDGVTYTAAPLTLGMIERYSTADPSQVFNPKNFGRILLECVQRNHPEVTKDFLFDNIEFKEAMDIFKEILEKSGLVSGEAMARI